MGSLLNWACYWTSPPIGLLDFFFSRIFGWWFSLFLLLGAAFLGYSLPSLSCQKDLSSFFVYAYDSNEKKINVQ